MSKMLSCLVILPNTFTFDDLSLLNDKLKELITENNKSAASGTVFLCDGNDTAEMFGFKPKQSAIEVPLTNLLSLLPYNQQRTPYHVWLVQLLSLAEKDTNVVEVIKYIVDNANNSDYQLLTDHNLPLTFFNDLQELIKLIVKH
jgi:hypothetical protein